MRSVNRARRKITWLGGVAITLGGALLAFLAIGLLHPRSPMIPLSSNDQTVIVDGCQIRYRVSGEQGPVIIFLHGFGGSLEEWEQLIARMPEAQCYALDLPGFGGSARTP